MEELATEVDRHEISFHENARALAIQEMRRYGEKLIRESVNGQDAIRDTEDDVAFQNVAAALELLGIDPNLSPEMANRFTVNDPTVRIESIGQAGEAKRKITVILRNRTGKPALLERTEEIVP